MVCNYYLYSFHRGGVQILLVLRFGTFWCKIHRMRLGFSCLLICRRHSFKHFQRSTMQSSMRRAIGLEE